MTQDKELEIQLQFLDEAQDYLQPIEAALMGLSRSGVNIEQVNAALRSTHSIKGGAGMMGYSTLSQLAHRLEDSFKVLKVQKQSVTIDAELEALLLMAVDHLRQVITVHYRREPIDDHWLESQIHPTFNQLYDRLGEPEAEDAQSMLSPEDGQDIIPLLFQTEVDGCLTRLEAAIANQDPRLHEEVDILAQELGGLGEMLQLPAFSQLCQSVSQHLSQAPDRLTEIAEQALQLWRRSQALVLTGNFAVLPDAIQLSGVTLERPIAESSLEDATAYAAEFDLAEFDFAEFDVVQPETVEGLAVDALPDDELTEVNAAFAAESDEFENAAAFDATELDFAEFDVVEPEPETALAIDPVELPITEALTSDAEVEPDFCSLDAAPLDADPLDPEPLDADPLDADSLNADPLDAVLLPDVAIEEEITFAASGLTPVDYAETATSAHSLNGATNDSTDAIAFEVIAEVTEAADDVRAKVMTEVTSDVISDVTSDVINPQPIGTKVETTSYEFKGSGSSESAPSSSENSVRVPIKQLNLIGDLFGELTIERNGLELQLKRLRNLVRSLGNRIQALEQMNVQLRSSSDRLSPQINSSLPLLNLGNNRMLRGFDEGNSRDRFDVLELDRYSDLHLMFQEVMEVIVQIQEVNSDLELGLDDVEQTARDLNKTSRQLQSKLTQVRMRPLSDVLDRFPRALRDLSLQYGKTVHLEVHGGNTLIDRNILDALSDPLMHLLRNAFDHGIEDAETRKLRGKPEQGTIEIRATHRQNRTLITLHDDGGGIPLDKIRSRAKQMGLDEVLLAAASDEELLSLIFEPGFSTSEQVTALSGRGVGMDVVRDRLRQVQGEIKVDTQAGLGTTFTLSVPFTLSVTRVLIAESNRMLLAFPTDAIEEMMVLDPTQILASAGSELFNWEGTMIQLVRLGQWLKFQHPFQFDGLETPASIGVPTVLLIRQGKQLTALQVDRCWGEQEVAVRQVEGNLPLPAGFSHCTILGDGRVVPLVNVSELLHWLISSARTEEGSFVPALPGAQPPQLPASQPTILIVDDSINVRRFLALTLEKAGYQVAQAKDGQDAIDKLADGLRVSAVICDIEMPRLDGYGFLAQIKSMPPFAPLPVAMLTSRSGDKHRQLAMSLGASAYFAKPYNEQVLLQTLDQLLATPASS